MSDKLRSTQTQGGSVLLDIQRGQMFCLNLVGSKIVELLGRGYDETRIAEDISNAYGVAADIARSDVREFLDVLRGHNIVQDRGPNGSI